MRGSDLPPPHCGVVAADGGGGVKGLLWGLWYKPLNKKV